MGQGTESCGGYEWDYDPYDEGLEDGEWTTKGGGTICVTKMSVPHLRNAKRLAERNAKEATFTDLQEKWQDWVELFERELDKREDTPAAPKVAKAPAKPPRGKMVQMICHCKQEYPAREADLKRGQGLSCSKSCAAIRREFGRPAAKRKPV